MSGISKDERTTIKTIAKLANVSIGTVDRALHNREGISEKTKARVLEIADRLSYEPNRFASMLIRNQKIHMKVIAPRSVISDEFDQGMKRAMSEMIDYNVKLDFEHTDDFNSEAQLAVLKKVNLDDYDAFLINASGPEIETFVEKAREKNKPVGFFNSDIPNSKRLFYIGQNSYMAGRLAGGLISKFLSPDKKVIIFTGFKDVVAHSQRCQGCIDELTALGKGDQLIDVYEMFDNPHYIREHGARLLEQYKGEIGAIFNTTGPIGLTDAIKKTFHKGEYPLFIAYDFNDSIRQDIEDGVCFATIFQSPFAQGYISVRLMADYLLDGSVPDATVYVPSRLIMKQNLTEMEDDSIYSPTKKQNRIFLW